MNESVNELKIKDKFVWQNGKLKLNIYAINNVIKN